MNLKMNERYLELPVSRHAAKKKLLFYHEGQLVFDIDVALDTLQPEYCQYLDMRPFLNLDLEIRCVPEISLSLKTAAEISGDTPLYEKYRPQVHFSPRRGWINDPNGLYYQDGLYHMFFQFNPASSDWGNMCWGHVISKDLLHWEDAGIALYPDEQGTMFSGSAIVDEHNVSGLKETEQAPVLLYYTAAGGNNQLSQGAKFTQCMAYSTDGGKTFQKYAKNPLISHVEAENRDPKVVWASELQAYLMALYLDENRYVIYISENLTDWKVHQSLVLPEDAECPDLYPLPLDGNSEKQKWIFSGAADCYLVGSITNGKFKPEQSHKRLHYGKNSYAAQTFSDIPAQDGRRIRIAWNTMNTPNTYFNNSMCFPTEMTLKTIGEEWCLCAMPIREISTLYQKVSEAGDLQVSAQAQKIQEIFSRGADIELEISINADSQICLQLFGLDIKLNGKENIVQCQDKKMPLCREAGVVHLRILADTLGVELFAGAGQAFMCIGYLCDYMLNWLEAKADSGSAVIKKCRVAELQSVIPESETRFP